LAAMIASDPDAVCDFFKQLSSSLYSKMQDLMAASDFSSSMTFYDDKKMKTDYTSYSTKISEAQEKLTDMEDRYYDQFAKMESAMAEINSSSSALSGFYG